ncbi:MAG: THUMP domain-containing protein [Thermoproteota archaeon]
MVISLLITHTSSGKTAAAEILDALLPLDADTHVILTRYEGVILVDTKIDPFQASSAIIRSLPSGIKKVVPLVAIVKASIPEIIDSTLKIMNSYKSNRSFAIRATVRGSRLEKKDIEEMVGATIKDKLGIGVDLKTPEIIVFIEVIDDIAGVSVISSSYPISIKAVF